MSAVNSPNNKTYSPTVEKYGSKTKFTITSPHDPLVKLVMYELPGGRIRYGRNSACDEDSQQALNNAAALAWARNAKAKKSVIIK